MSVTRLPGARRQRGTTMVEVSVTLALFLALVFGIIDFALAYHAWARTAEAARDAVRYAIVNDPVAAYDGVEVACTADECAPLLAVVQRVAPFVQGGDVHLRYALSGAGNPDRPESRRIPEVTVEIRAVPHDFLMPGILGIDATIALPTARATRTGEDMFTETGGT